MKKILLIACTICCFASIGKAQDRRDHGEVEQKMKSMRIAYISEKLDLTPEEAQTFWPVYNKYETQRKTLRKTYKDNMNDEEIQNLTEAEAAQEVSALIDFEEKDLSLKKEFIQDVKGVLSMKKIAMLLKAERSFRKRVVKRLGERRKEGREGQRFKRGN